MTAYSSSRESAYDRRVGGVAVVSPVVVATIRRRSEARRASYALISARDNCGRRALVDLLTIETIPLQTRVLLTAKQYSSR